MTHIVKETEAAFVAAHPKIAERFKNDLGWLNVYTDYKDGKVNERWERNAEGFLVDVTKREKLKEDIANAREELAKLNGTLLTGGRK
jgi:hypothetical protein